MTDAASVLAGLESSDQIRLTVEGTSLYCDTHAAHVEDTRIVVLAESSTSRRRYRIETQWTSGAWLTPLVDVGDPDSPSEGFTPWGTLQAVEPV